MKWLALFMLLTSQLFAASWHVRSTAACTFSGDGTASTCAASGGAAGAWKGLANITWASVAAGDSVFLSGGDTYTDTMTVGKSGTGTGATYTLPITISVEGTSSGTNPAIIDANGLTNIPIDISGKDYIIVDGLFGQASVADSSHGTPNLNYGLKIINANGTAAAPAGCVQDYGAGRFKAYHIDCSGTGGDNTDQSRAGIMENSSAKAGYEFAYNYIHGTYTGATQSLRWHMGGVTCFCGTASTSFTEVLVHDNYMGYLFNDGSDLGNNSSMYNNETTHIEGSGHSDSLQCQGGSYCAIYNNWAHDNGDQNIYLDKIGGTDITAGHIRIYNNLVQSTGAAANAAFGIVLHPEQANWDDVVIANNTFYNMNSNIIRKGGACAGTCPHSITNLVMLNNIFGTAATTDQVDFNTFASTSFADANAYDYNVYMTPAFSGSFLVSNLPNCTAGTGVECTLAQLKALGTPRETNGQAANPTFISSTNGADVHPASGDAIAKAKGRNLTATYSFLTTDKDGNARSAGAAWDIGAYNSSGAVVVSPSAPSLGMFSWLQDFRGDRWLTFKKQ